MFEEAGYDMTIYDIFYADDPTVLQKNTISSVAAKL